MPLGKGGLICDQMHDNQVTREKILERRDRMHSAVDEEEGLVCSL